jgi:hypothetical protein
MIKDNYTLSPNSWFGEASTELEIKNLRFENTYHQAAQEKAIELLTLLKKNLITGVASIEVFLSIRKSPFSERLQRGINEMGIIAPDFGKDFLGAFFDHLEIHLTTSGELTQSKQEFLVKYTKGLIRNHFIEQPTAYSNWELSHHNPKASSRNHASGRVNFPAINIDVF